MLNNFFLARGAERCKTVRMKTVRINLADDDIVLLEKARSLGFHSASEVVRCAALSLIQSSGGNFMTDFDRCPPASSHLPIEPTTEPHRLENRAGG